MQLNFTTTANSPNFTSTYYLLHKIKAYTLLCNKLTLNWQYTHKLNVYSKLQLTPNISVCFYKYECATEMKSFTWSAAKLVQQSTRWNTVSFPPQMWVSPAPRRRVTGSCDLQLFLHRYFPAVLGASAGLIGSGRPRDFQYSQFWRNDISRQRVVSIYDVRATPVTTFTHPH